MKSTTIRSLHIDEKLRSAVEEVLNEGETLSNFVVQSIRESIERRQSEKAFVARGLRARDEARKTGDYISATTVLANLEKKLLKAKAAAKRKTSAAAKTKSRK